MSRTKSLERYRNIGIIAHIDAGKTTTTERILFYTGKTYRIGSVDDGTTITDYLAQERERGITIVSAAVTTEWNDHQINIIDTPGHIDFTAEVQRSLRVLDGGVVVFDATQGVEPQSETVWRQADRYKVPRICFINKMDRVGASFDMSVDSIRQRLGANPIKMQIPIGEEANFTGVIDILTQKAVYWEDELGKEPRTTDIPPDMRTLAHESRNQLIEKISELDDLLTVKFLEEEEISLAEMKAALRKAVLSGKATPVFCGSSLRNKGIQLLLDGIVDYLPSPYDIPPVVAVDPVKNVEVQREPKDDAPLSALVFKIVSDPYVGRLAYVRVYSGTFAQGTMVLNSIKGKKERVGRLLRMYADHREDISEVMAGDIGAVIGLKDTFTGDTLCDQHHPVVLENISFPEPVISVAIEPKTSADQDKLGSALRKLSEEDPTFKVHTDENTAQTIISGMGELHLDVLIDRMFREFNVQANVGKPRVSYRETILKSVINHSHKYVKQTGGKGFYGHVIINVEPISRGNGVIFENKASGSDVPKDYVNAVEKGIMEATDSGILAGYPITDIKVTLTGGSFHEVDSNEMAFKMAANFAFKEAMKKGSPILLEPIMKVEVHVPEEYMGDVISQLSSRRGLIQSTEPRPGKAQAIHAFMPVGEMFGYATELRSCSQGRGLFSMEFDHYEQVSSSVAEKLLA